MTIAVIGAGASGMTAAVTAAGEGAQVTLFEKNDRVGKKILATGNGKCNLGNLEFDMEQYYCADKEKLSAMFRIFSTWDTISFFENMGLMVKSKNGCLYPYSEQASSVLDILRMELVRRGINVVTDAEIREAVYDDEEGKFLIRQKDGKSSQFDKLIIACGSPASLKKGEGMTGYALAEHFGHKIKPVVPGLTQLQSKDDFIRALAGVRCQAHLQLMIDGREAGCETGELQFTSYGISGIPVFQMSRKAAYALEEKQKVEVLINFFPDRDEKTFTCINQLRYEALKDKTLENYLIGTLNKKIGRIMLKQAQLKPAMKAEEAGLEKVQKMMSLGRHFVVHISGVHSAEHAQVCAGGVDFAQVSPQLESILVKGLYFAGEILDVDGKCGGYNLQWAWTSGYIAGRNAAGNPTEDPGNDLHRPDGGDDGKPLSC